LDHLEKWIWLRFNLLLKHIKFELFVAFIYPILKRREILRDPHFVCFNSTLFIEGRDFKRFIMLVVFLVERTEHCTDSTGDSALIEVVNHISDNRPVFLFLLQHSHDKLGKASGVLGNGFGLFVYDAIEKSAQGVLLEWMLETSHSIQSYSQTPNIAPLVIPFIFYYLW